MSNDIGKLIGLVMTLVVAVFVLWAVSPAFSALFTAAPSPSGPALSTYSTYQDATDTAAIVMDIIIVASGIIGIRITKEPKLMLGIAGVLFLIFLASSL